MLTKKMPKNAKIFSCENCGFSCSKKSNYDKHLLTRKHKMLTNGNEKMPKNAAPLYECECGKKYKQSSGLSRHKKICNFMKKVKILNKNCVKFPNLGPGTTTPGPGSGSCTC